LASKAKGLSNKIGDLWNKGKTKVKNDFIEADKAFCYAMKKLGEYVPKFGGGPIPVMEGAGKIPSGGKNLLKDAYQYMKDTGEKVFGSGEKDVVKGASGLNSIVKNVNPSEIRFSQTSVSGSEEIIASMKVNGWKGDPIDVVRMTDGNLTTIDNTRVAAAREAGIEVQATIRNYNDPLPANMVDRLTTKKGVPKTWGEALDLRIQKQKSSFRNNNPMGSYDLEKMK